MRLLDFLNEMAKTIRARTREDFEKHIDEAVKSSDFSFDVYGSGSKSLIAKKLRNKIKKASPVERERMLKKYILPREIKAQGIEEVIIHYGDFNVVWRP